MSWHPTDLVSDADLLAYESTLLQTFGVATFEDKIGRALEDWLWPTLRANGFTPATFRTRYVADDVWGYTSSAYTDLQAETEDTTEDDINLATVLASASDYLYIGSTQTFRGIYLRMLDNVSSASGVLTVQYWAERWRTLAVADRTIATAGKTLSAGGSVTWTLPVDWATRKVNSSDLRYWARLSTSATPTGAKAGQIGCIRRSLLCAPVTMRALGLVFTEAPTRASEGPWREKADWYLREAELALQKALPLIGGEFDSDASEQIDSDEAAQTADEVSDGGWTLERA